VRGGSHPACHRPRQSRADAAHGVQVVRTVARSTWTPWTTPAPRSVGRRQTGWELRRVVGRRGETRTCSANNQSSSSDDEPRRTENTKTAISVRMTRTATSPCVGGRRNLPARGHHAATAVMTEGCWSLGSLSPWESPQLWLSAPGLSTRYPSQSTKSTAPSFTLVERGARTYRGRSGRSSTRVNARIAAVSGYLGRPAPAGCRRAVRPGRRRRSQWDGQVSVQVWHAGSLLRETGITHAGDH
jgi:hypothetical protein